MKLLVTGGAGFIGANFVNYWMANHPADRVTVLDSMTYAANLERLAAVEKNPLFSFVNGDIQDFELAKKLCKDAETVVHFAAESHVDRSLAGFEAEKLFLRTNAEGTLCMLYAAKESGVSRFHHVSTDEVYGDLSYETTEKFHEEFPYNPHNPYSISKATSDFSVRCFAKTRGLAVTISNCTNNYGPFQTPEKVIPRSIALLLKDQKIQLYTDINGVPGPNIRDWLYVEDHCKGIEAILLKGKIGETYCLGGHCELSNYQLVQRILSLMSSITGKTYTMDSHVSFVADRPGHDKRYAMETKKIERELGWKPQYTFDLGFRSTVEWYTSLAGKQWLNNLEQSTKEVRQGQSKKI